MAPPFIERGATDVWAYAATGSVGGAMAPPFIERTSVGEWRPLMTVTRLLYSA